MTRVGGWWKEIGERIAEKERREIVKRMAKEINYGWRKDEKEMSESKMGTKAHRHR